MEVHHHAHLASGETHTARKKWTHYFWEFLMLFLAVFCGFLAEYWLEHKIEKDRERQYVRSLVEDLERDTATLNSRIAYCNLTIARADSAIAVFNGPGLATHAGEIYYFLRWMHRSDIFSVNDRTIIQLRNAGGMRLVSNKSVSDSIIDYYKEVEYIKFIYEEQVEWRRALRPYFPEIFNGNDYGKAIDERNTVIRPVDPVNLQSSDPKVISALVLTLNNIKGINIALRRRMGELKIRARDIREFIIKAYHL
ncbi:MAG TPA: hypothetical protein VFT15_02630 [Chitinophagaceae bacterium]|nr:hypothetical protein [Chitinophagaceae bacterium]